MEVLNGTDADINAVLYHSADCQLQGSDDGYGFLDPVGGGIYCSENADNSPAGRIEGFAPLSPGSNYLETEYEANWLAIDGNPLPDSCDCDILQDNGAGLSWDIAVPANGSVTRSLLTTFSPTGETPPPPTSPPANLALDPASATNPIETEHCVTATVTDANGNPNEGISVVFSVSGTSSDSGTATSDASGEAQFCYSGPALPGTDEITAFADTDGDSTQNGDEPSGSASKTWEIPDSNCGVKITGGAWIQTSFRRLGPPERERQDQEEERPRRARCASARAASTSTPGTSRWRSATTATSPCSASRRSTGLEAAPVPDRPLRSRQGRHRPGPHGHGVRLGHRVGAAGEHQGSQEVSLGPT